MKKNKVFIFLALIFIIQLAVPLSIMGTKEVASENGLQGKMKVSSVWYSALSETLEFNVSQVIYTEDGVGSYIPVHLSEDGYIVCEDRISIKPEGAYIDWDIFSTRRTEYKKHQLDFIISENELNRLTLTRMSDLSIDDFYVTVSIYNGEVIFKELWEGDRKLVEFR